MEGIFILCCPKLIASWRRQGLSCAVARADTILPGFRLAPCRLQTGAFSLRAFVINARPKLYVKPDVFNHCVRSGDKLFAHANAFGLVKVERDRTLVAVQVLVVLAILAASSPSPRMGSGICARMTSASFTRPAGGRPSRQRPPASGQ